MNKMILLNLASCNWLSSLEEAWQPTPVFLPGESPWTEEPGGLQSTGSQRVRHDWATKHSTAQLAFIEMILFCIFTYKHCVNVGEFMSIFPFFCSLHSIPSSSYIFKCLAYIFQLFKFIQNVFSIIFRCDTIDLIVFMGQNTTRWK